MRNISAATEPLTWSVIGATAPATARCTSACWAAEAIIVNCNVISGQSPHPNLRQVSLPLPFRLAFEGAELNRALTQQYRPPTWV